MIPEALLYGIILTSTSIVDVKEKIIPPVFSILIFGIAMGQAVINGTVKSAMVGMLVATLPFFIVALVKENSIGGGDIKYVAANTCFLGLEKGLMGRIAALMIAVVAQSIIYKIQNKKLKESFALAPYLSIGFFLAYIL